MTIKIYTWSTGETNILCEPCSEYLFSLMADKLILENPTFDMSQIQALIDQIINSVGDNAIDCKFECIPINTDKITGTPICFSKLPYHTWNGPDQVDNDD